MFATRKRRSPAVSAASRKKWRVAMEASSDSDEVAEVSGAEAEDVNRAEPSDAPEEARRRWRPTHDS